MPAEPKKTLIKNINRKSNTNFSRLQARKKLLLKLDGEMAIIMSNADKLEICPFFKFIWGQHHHIAFGAIIRSIH